MINFLIRKIKCLGLTIFFVILTLQSSFAITQFNVVYRSDTRPPYQIRQDGGFTPWSLIPQDGVLPEADLDLSHHLQGSSIFSRTSPFVSTSSILRGAVRAVAGSAAFQLSNGDPNPEAVAYIYRIRPNENFYNVPASLETLLDMLEPDSDQAWKVSELLENFDREREVSSLGTIPYERIIDYAVIYGNMVEEYGLDDDSVLYTEEFWQDRWQNTESTYNEDYDNDLSNENAYTNVGTTFASGVYTANNITSETSPTAIHTPLSMSCLGSTLGGESEATNNPFFTATTCTQLELEHIGDMHFPITPETGEEADTDEATEHSHPDL